MNRWMPPRVYPRLMLALIPLTLAACGSDAPEDDAQGMEEEHAEDVVVLDSVGLAAAGIELATVDSVSVSRLPVTGAITFDPSRVSHIGPRTEGRITALRVDLGSIVRHGQLLAVLESPEVARTRADMREAEALVRIARENYERERRLEAQGISSRRELLDAEAELRREEAALLRAAELLQALGAGNGEGGEFAITAPFDGVIAEKHATLGEVVSPADQIFTVADLSRLWLEIAIYERDLGAITLGQEVDVDVAAYPGRRFSGSIVSIGSIVDPNTRTLPARVELANPDRALRPGMFATAQVRLGAGSSVLVVPLAAVQEIEGRKVVFVPGAQPGEFRAVAIQTGDAMDAGVVVLSGVDAGDSIVTTGSFLLRSELAEGEIGEHGH